MNLANGHSMHCFMAAQVVSALTLAIICHEVRCSTCEQRHWPSFGILWSHNDNDHRRSQISAADVSLLVTCWSVQKRIWALEMLQSKMWKKMSIRRCSKWLDQESTTHCFESIRHRGASLFQSVSQTGVLFCEHRPREGGHFLCLRSIGLPAEEFAIGFGPQAGEPNGKKRPKRAEMMWNVSPFDFLSDHWSSFVTFSCFVLTLHCLVSLTLSWFWERLVLPCFFCACFSLCKGKFLNLRSWTNGKCFWRSGWEMSTNQR